MGPTERILVGENSALLRRMLGDVLMSQGWTVLEACDGPTALDIARTEAPEVLEEAARGHLTITSLAEESRPPAAAEDRH